MNNNTKKHYISFDPSRGYPTGKNLFYECTKCSDIFPSWPQDSVTCSCGNLHIDIHSGRLIVKDHTFFKIFST
jgi:hypothetical protein